MGIKRGAAPQHREDRALIGLEAGTGWPLSESFLWAHVLMSAFQLTY